MDAITTDTNVAEAPPGPTPEDVERAEIARRVERNNAEAIAQIRRRTGAPVQLITALLAAINRIDDISDLRDMIRNLCEEALSQ
jgi:hypothetical protein